MENNKYEIQNKILNIDDVNLSSRIFLYFLVSKFVDTRDNNIETKFEEIRVIIGYGLSKELKYGNYIVKETTPIVAYENLGYEEAFSVLNIVLFIF